MVTGKGPRRKRSIYPSSHSRGPRVYGKLWEAWKAGLDSGAPSTPTSSWSMDTQKLPLYPLPPLPQGVPRQTTSWSVPFSGAVPEAGLQEGSGQPPDQGQRASAPQHAALSPLSPLAFAVGLRWERRGGGGLVRPQGSE